MYASIHYLSIATPVQVLADVVKILTGETQISNLTVASINAEDSFINNSVSVAGWTLHDNVSPNEVVLRSPITDMPGEFKYIRLSTCTTGSSGQVNTYANGIGGVRWEPYESWNAVSHVGVMYKRKREVATDLNSPSNTSGRDANMIYAQSSFAGKETTVCLSSSAKHFFATMITNNGIHVNGVSFITEISRASPWDTVINGYKPIIYNAIPMHGHSWTSSSISFPLAIRPVVPKSVTEDYNINATLVEDYKQTFHWPVSSFGGAKESTTFNTGVGTLSYILNASKVPINFMYGFGVHNMVYGNAGGDVSSLCNVFLGSYAGQPNDRFVSGGNNYRVWPMTTTATPNSSPSNVLQDAPPSNDSNIPRFIVREG